MKGDDTEWLWKMDYQAAKERCLDYGLEKYGPAWHGRHPLEKAYTSLMNTLVYIDVAMANGMDHENEACLASLQIRVEVAPSLIAALESEVRSGGLSGFEERDVVYYTPVEGEDAEEDG